MMQAQHNARTNPGLADFSAALMRANRKAGQEDNEFEQASTARTSTTQAYDSTANRNISSLISQIQDDGPANSSTAAANAVKPRAVKPADSFATETNGMLSDDVLEISSVQNRATTENNKLHEFEIELAKSVRQAPSNTWLQFTVMMLITVIALMGFVVFKLVGETGDLRMAVENQQDQLPAVFQPAPTDSDTSAKLQQLLGSVQVLNSELVAVNAQQQQLQDLVTAIIPDDFEQQLNQLSGLGNTVTGLQTDLTRVQQTLKGLNTESRRVAKSSSASQAVVKAEPKPVARRIVSSSTTSVVADNWIVNLASLSTQQQAQLALNKLQLAGVAPLIQETVVNGKRVYRLSVDGFSTRDAAMKFIAHAKSRLGFDGGWARRG